MADVIQTIDVKSYNIDGKPINKRELYIVTVEVPFAVSKRIAYRVETYVATRVDKLPASIEIQAYNVTDIKIKIDATLKEITEYKDAIEFVQKESEYQYLSFPWSRIISIKTIKLNCVK